MLRILGATAPAISDKIFVFLVNGLLSLLSNLAMRHKVPFAIDDLSDVIFLNYLKKVAVFFKEAVFWQYLKVKLAAYNSCMVYSFVCLDHSKIGLNCSLTDQSW